MFGIIVKHFLRDLWTNFAHNDFETRRTCGGLGSQLAEQGVDGAVGVGHHQHALTHLSQQPDQPPDKITHNHDYSAATTVDLWIWNRT
jgi:hypothetical protein